MLAYKVKNITLVGKAEEQKEQAIIERNIQGVAKNVCPVCVATVEEL